MTMHILFPIGLWSLRLIYRQLFPLASSSPCISHRAVFPPCITRINNNTFAMVERAFAVVQLVDDIVIVALRATLVCHEWGAPITCE
jgi:hypothetical protein